MPVHDIPGVAGSTLTDKKWYTVEKNDDGKWDLTTTDGGTAKQAGVLQSDNKSDGALVDTDPISIRIFGESFVIADAQVQEGVPLTPGATDGSVKTAVAATYVIGTAIDPASAQSVRFRAFINPQGQLNA